MEKNVKSVMWQKIILLSNLTIMISKPSKNSLGVNLLKAHLMNTNIGSNFPNRIILVKSRKSHVDAETEKLRRGGN